MNSYTIRARPFLWAPAKITRERLEELVEPAAVEEPTPMPEGHYRLGLTLTRKDHYEAFNAVFEALQQLGYEVVEAKVAEWADQLVEGTVLGIVSGGVIGSPSESAELTLLAALLGGIVGAVAGSRIKKIKTLYEVVPAYPSGWTLREIPERSPGLDSQSAAG